MSLRAPTRRGYALGSVATGTFGTVPGLLLLPYLTDTLGIAAGLAGVIVFAPKAWDVVLNPKLIVEVLSESTERYDRGDKFTSYRTIARELARAPPAGSRSALPDGGAAARP